MREGRITTGTPRAMSRARGFSLIEIAIVIAVIGIVAAIAVPSMTKSFASQRLRESALLLDSALNLGRSEAIRTGNVHVVFYMTDALGAPLTDGGGNPVAVLVLDDGRPGAAGQNCLIDPGEPIYTVPIQNGIAAGVTGAPGSAPSDLGTGNIATGSSFKEPGGAAASWVLFRPEGAPFSFDSACATGPLGSGAGAFYFTNADRTAAVALMPTGGTRIHTYDGMWSN